MKLSDASVSRPHQDSTRYIARIETVLSWEGIRRIQKCVQAYTRDHSRVLVAPSQCLGVIHKRADTSVLLSDIVQPSGISLSTQEMKVSRISVKPEDVIIFSLLPGGSVASRALYRGLVKDWADDLIVEEVEWKSWVALVTTPGFLVSTGN